MLTGKCSNGIVKPAHAWFASKPLLGSIGELLVSHLPECWPVHGLVHLRVAASGPDTGFTASALIQYPTAAGSSTVRK